MNPSDSLHLDENLARLLAAYDQSTEGGDGRAPTIDVPRLLQPIPGEEPVGALDGHPHEGSLGEVLPEPDPEPARWVPQPTPPTPPPIGTHRVGRFELRRQLGKGGCGIVFLAYDPKLEREVALKIPRPEMLLSPEARRRLVREALAAAEFDHPNLVPVYETGEIGPVCFIATAFCPGVTLGEWLDRQAFPVPVRQAARLMATIAEAVQHAHDRGVLHRDLKPNNVILQPAKEDPNETEPPPGSCQLRGETVVPRVVDFGLAKLVERGGPSETTTRQIIGTPKYMAPEQAQARHADIGPAADVYALGVMLYELLTGRAPYEGASDVEVLRQSIDGHLTPPRHVRADTPRDLEAICLKAMERLPGRRYRTAIDFADDLRRFLDGKPTLARPLKWVGRATKWLHRNDQIVALVVIVLFASVFAVVGGWNTVQLRRLKASVAPPVRVAAPYSPDRVRADRERDYSRQVRDAFLAWRGGDARGAAAALAAARGVAKAAGDDPDFALAYLSKLAAGRLAIACPAGAVTALAVSPDGRRLASGHADGTLAVWDRASGNQLGTATGAGRGVTHVVFALGGTRLFAADGTRGASWAVAPDGALTPAPGDGRHPGATCVAVGPDGKTVYAGDSDGRVYRLDPGGPAADARPVELSPGDAVTALAVSPGGACVLVGTRAGRIVPCDADLRRLYPDRDDGWGGPVSALGPPSDDGEEFAAGFENGRLGFSPVPWLPGLPHAAARVHWVVRTSEGVATNGPDGWVRFGCGRGRDLPTTDAGPVRGGAVSPDGKTLFTGGDDGVIRSWNLPADLRQVGCGSRFDRAVSAAGVHPDGTRVVTADRGGATDRAGTGAEERVGFDGTPSVVRFPADGPAVAAYLEQKAAFVRAVKADSKPTRFDPPEKAAATAVDLSLDGFRLAVGDDSGRVTVWNVAGRVPVAAFDTGVRRPVERVALSDDGRFVAAPAAGVVNVWAVGEPPDASPVTAVPADDPALIRFLPGGERLATATRGGAVRVWNVATVREDLVLFGHVGRVTGLGASPDGRTLVTGGANGEVKFWDLRTGQELLSLRRHAGPVAVVEFAANGKLLVTAGDSLAVWDAGE